MVLTEDRDRLRLEEERLLAISLLQDNRVRLGRVQLLVDAKTFAHRHCYAATFHSDVTVRGLSCSALTVMNGGQTVR